VHLVRSAKQRDFLEGGGRHSSAVPGRIRAASAALPTRSRGVLAVAAALALAACGARVTAPSGARAEPRLVGRFDRGDPAGPRFAWSGSTLELRFRGQGLAVRLRAAPLPDKKVTEATTAYAVLLDGRPMPDLAVHPGEGRYVVADGLDASRSHTVALTREAEAWAGVHQLLAVEVAGGELLAPPPPRAAPIEVVGDSISCGYGALGAEASCPFSFATERASAAFPALVGRALDRDVVTVCWSGRGVLRNWDGSASGAMPELYLRAIPEPAVAFDFAREPEPAVVITALGTNDFLGGSEPIDPAAFEAAYAAFLAKVRALRPHAWILVAESPMLPPEPVEGRGDLRAAARRSLERVVASRAAAGDGRVELLPLPWQGDRRGCDHHPNAAMHRELAARVGAAVRAKLGP
jgi:lysophospholipase L1-like esterase